MHSPLIQFLGFVGVVLIVTMNKSFEAVRERIWPALLKCPQCFGVWVGTAGYYWIEQDRVFVTGWAALWVMSDALLLGFAVSLVSYILYCYIHSLGAP